jgi:hypothetical protein
VVDFTVQVRQKQEKTRPAAGFVGASAKAEGCLGIGVVEALAGQTL